MQGEGGSFALSSLSPTERPSALPAPLGFSLAPSPPPALYRLPKSPLQGVTSTRLADPEPRGAPLSVSAPLSLPQCWWGSCGNRLPLCKPLRRHQHGCCMLLVARHQRLPGKGIPKEEQKDSLTTSLQTMPHQEWAESEASCLTTNANCTCC